MLEVSFATPICLMYEKYEQISDCVETKMNDKLDKFYDLYY
jgi:hypothetical protein